MCVNRDFSVGQRLAVVGNDIYTTKSGSSRLFAFATLAASIPHRPPLSPVLRVDPKTGPRAKIYHREIIKRGQRQYLAKALRQTSCSKIRLALNCDVAHRLGGIDIPGIAQCLRILEILKQPVLEDSSHNKTDNQIIAGWLSCHFSNPQDFGSDKRTQRSLLLSASTVTFSTVLGGSTLSGKLMLHY